MPVWLEVAVAAAAAPTARGSCAQKSLQACRTVSTVVICGVCDVCGVMDARLAAGCQGGTGSAARFVRCDGGCSVVCGSQKNRTLQAGAAGCGCIGNFVARLRSHWARTPSFSSFSRMVRTLKLGRFSLAKAVSVCRRQSDSGDSSQHAFVAGGHGSDFPVVLRHAVLLAARC